MAKDVTMTQGFCDPAATFTSNVSADDTVVIGAVTYTFKASPSAAYEVDIGGDLEGSIDNLVAAINASGVAGTTYGTETLAHPLVTGEKGSAATLDLRARGAGIFFNSIYLAATSPGANDISVGGVTVAAAIAAGAGTLGAGGVDDFVSGLLTLNQINAEVMAELKLLTDAAD